MQLRDRKKYLLFTLLLIIHNILVSYNISICKFFFKKPKCEFPTILDMLEIDDAVIANCLIDQVINVQHRSILS